MDAVEDDEAVGVFVGEGEGEGLAGFEVELGEGAEGVAGGEGEGLVEEEGGKVKVAVHWPSASWSSWR